LKIIASYSKPKAAAYPVRGLRTKTTAYLMRGARHNSENLLESPLSIISPGN
jgi:hypothetical protein